jgi:hypothetical protein
LPAGAEVVTSNRRRADTAAIAKPTRLPVAVTVGLLDHFEPGEAPAADFD